MYTRCTCKEFDKLWQREVYEYYSPPGIFEVHKRTRLWGRDRHWGRHRTKHWFYCDPQTMPLLTFYTQPDEPYRPKKDPFCEVMTNKGKENEDVKMCLAKVKQFLQREGKRSLIWLVHGLNGNEKKMKRGPEWPLLKDALLNNYPNSIVGLVIWEKAASPFTGWGFVQSRKLPTGLLPSTYHNSAISAWPIGNILAYVNYEIYSGCPSCPSSEFADTYCIGHSIGAHLCGFYGKMMKRLKREVEKILALDPAGPIFDKHKGVYKLQSSDANFVEVWHSNTHRLGYQKTLGHVDIYINGGFNQPNCGVGFGLMEGNSHKLAYRILKTIVDLSGRCVAEWLCRTPKPGVEQWCALKNIKKENVKKLILAGCTKTFTKKFHIGQMERSETPDIMDNDVYWIEITPNSRTCPENKTPQHVPVGLYCYYQYLAVY